MSWIRRSPKETVDIIGSYGTNGEVMDKIYGCTEVFVSFFLFGFFNTFKNIETMLIYSLANF